MSKRRRPGDFLADYALLGAQRNTKIVGIFVRLWKRDGKPRYLDYIPRVWAMLERDLASRAGPGGALVRCQYPGDLRDPAGGGSFWHEQASVSDTAMVLAAGIGKRMRPLTAAAQAAGARGGQAADRPCARQAGRGGRRARWSMPIIWPTSSKPMS
jgi:hypothetical protein